MNSTTTDGDRWLEAPGRPRLRYRDAGRGPAVLLVHGWPLDLTMYDSLAATLAGEFRVVRWDRRGFGASAGTPSLVDDVVDGLRLLDGLGLERAAVLGTSQGCRVALAVVEAAPARIAALVLDGAPALNGLPERGWLNETPVHDYRTILLERGIEALRAELAAHPLLQLRTDDPSRHERLAGMLQRYRGADLLALAPTAPSGVTPSMSTRFASLRLPVLVLNGELDTAQRLHVGTTLEAAIAGAVRRVVPRSGHLACWDDPATYAELVRTFLAEALNDPPR